MSSKLTEVLGRLDLMEKSIAVQSAKHDAVFAKLTQQEKTIEEIEESMEMLGSQYDEILKKVKTQEDTTLELNKKMSKTESEMSKQEMEIRELKTTVDNMEQYSRRKNVEIHGIQKEENENLLEMIQCLANKLQLPVPATEDVEAVHRLSAREGKIPPIIVRFNERSARDQWLTKRVALRQEKIFINENLTKSVRELLWSARQWAKEKNYKFVWVKNGKIFVRQSEHRAVIRINRQEDLLKIA
uniref:Putative crack-1 is transposable element n=1 Tax=Ixodes ricinus TaxID=34613 RepID=A0A147BAN2_IXORI